jgi:peptide/nickel transport system substrate-binding protein
MRLFLRLVSVAGLVSMAFLSGGEALAQKQGGILRVYLTANPPNLSILELATIVGEMPAMGIFNNLIMFDQHVAQVSLQSVVPDLAESWSWNEAGTELTFKLRHGVKWHDGQPFTAKDVVCTWDLMADNGARQIAAEPAQIVL